MYNHPDPYLGFSSSMAWDASYRGEDQTPLRSRKQRNQEIDLQMMESEQNGLGMVSPAAKETPKANVAPRREPLVVSVAIRFPGLITGSTYSREYASSLSFDPTERMCQGLLRRIEHCTQELITRKDSSALIELHRDSQQPKPLRYELTFRIVRRGEDWAARTFKAFQKESLTNDAAEEIALGSHMMVGLFLTRHDEEFRWTDAPFREQRRQSTRTKPIIGEPTSLCCIPRAQFTESSGRSESTPGYSIEFTFGSRSHCRKPTVWRRVLRVNSRQESPLNLASAENLLWRAFKVVGDEVDSRTAAFYAEHEGCEWLEGVVACQHFEEDALDVTLRIANSLGPNYDHLRRTIRSKLSLFRHPDGSDCEQFLGSVQAHLVEARDSADDQLCHLPDVDFRVLELQGRGWKIDDVARFSLPASTRYSRRTVTAMMDRVRTGIADVLRGNDIAIHVSAYKQGHLILDKAIIAHAGNEKRGETFTTPEEERDAFVLRLKSRIQQDMDMVTQDTCSLAGIPEDETPVEALLELPAEVPEMPESRSPSPAARKFALVPQRKGSLVNRRISEIQDALDSVTLDTEETSRPPTPALSFGTDASPRNSRLVTPTMVQNKPDAHVAVVAPLELEDRVQPQSILDDIPLIAEPGKGGLAHDFDELIALLPETPSRSNVDGRSRALADEEDGGEEGIESDDCGESSVSESCATEPQLVAEATLVLSNLDEEGGGEERTEPDNSDEGSVSENCATEPQPVPEVIPVPLKLDEEDDGEERVEPDSCEEGFVPESCTTEPQLVPVPLHLDKEDDGEEVTEPDDCEVSASENRDTEPQAVPEITPVLLNLDEDYFSTTKPTLDLEDDMDRTPTELDSEDDEDLMAHSSDAGVLMQPEAEERSGEEPGKQPVEPSEEQQPEEQSVEQPVAVELPQAPGHDGEPENNPTVFTDVDNTQGGSRSVSGSTVVFTADSLLQSAPRNPEAPKPSRRGPGLKRAVWSDFVGLPRARPSVLASARMLSSHTLWGADSQANDSVETLVEGGPEEGEGAKPHALVRRGSVATAGYLGLHEAAFPGLFDAPVRGHKRAQSTAVLLGPAKKSTMLGGVELRRAQSGLKGEEVNDGVMPRVVMMFSARNLHHRPTL